MKRIFLFVAINLLVVTTISLVTSLFGIRPYLAARGIDYQSLLVFCAVWGFGGALVSLQLSRFMAKMSLGVRLIDPENPEGRGESKLVETVRRLARGAGLPVLPEIGIYESPEVNAFATGPSKRRALVAVSSGLLARMDDRAVEGVLGHELSHVANGDMVTMTLIQGIVNTFVMFFARIAAYAIDNALRSRDDDRRGGGLGYYGYWMIQSVLETALMLLALPLIAWVSRLREFRADAGSAKLAGPETMIHALESLRPALGLVDNSSGALRTLKINGGRGGWLALIATHPPIDARIAALRRIRS